MILTIVINDCVLYVGNYKGHNTYTPRRHFDVLVAIPKSFHPTVYVAPMLNAERKLARQLQLARCRYVAIAAHVMHTSFDEDVLDRQSKMNLFGDKPLN